MKLIIILSIATLIFLVIGYRLKSWQIIGYSFLCLLAGVFLQFLEQHPEVKVSSPYLALEKQVQSVDSSLKKVATKQEDIGVTQKQLQKIVTTLTKMILVVEDGVGKFGDNRPQRDKLLQEYKKEIQSLIPREFSKGLNRDIESLYKTP
ncbi:MAG: hypothetical protein AB1401_14695 [Thermodesulfobacteriota bacterium]